MGCCTEAATGSGKGAACPRTPVAGCCHSYGALWSVASGTNGERYVPGEKNAANGWDVGIHVDGASGAFVAPFIFPEVKVGPRPWLFRATLH